MKEVAMKKVIVIIIMLLFASGFSHSVFAEQDLAMASSSGDGAGLSAQVPPGHVSLPISSSGGAEVSKVQPNDSLASRGGDNGSGDNAYFDPATGMKFILVKGGCYAQSGTPGVDGSVAIKPSMNNVCVDDYYMGVFEVTQSQWRAIMGSNPAGFIACGDDCPVENVSWHDAQKFIQALDQKSGQSYRLPTDAEWEYAAQSGDKKSTDAGAVKAADYIDSVAFANDSRGPQPMSKMHPNGLGIYGMTGSLWEWTADWYSNNTSNYPPGIVDGPSYGRYRTLRGGSWIDKPKVIETSLRIRYAPWVRRTWIGLRLVSPVSSVAVIKAPVDVSAKR